MRGRLRPGVSFHEVHAFMEEGGGGGGRCAHTYLLFTFIDLCNMVMIMQGSCVTTGLCRRLLAVQ